MSLTSPRADNLAFIRDILVLIFEGKITDQENFDTYLAKNKGWEKSRRYHYLSALRDLHFVTKEKSNIKLEETGKKLAQIGISNFGDLDGLNSHLNEQEKELFRHYFLKYLPFIKFLSLFLEKEEIIKDYSIFLKKGKAIGFVFDKSECNQKIVRPDGYQIGLSGWKVIKPGGASRSLSKTDKHAVMWTLKYWGKTLDLIDELWIPEFREYLGRFRKAIFPVKIKDEEISLDTFQDYLDDLIRRQNYPSSYIPIPILIHDFCTTYFLKVKSFLKFLCLLHFRSPGEYYLDKVSRAYIDERLHSIGKKRKKLKEGHQIYQRSYTNYPRIDDFYCSHLVVRGGDR